MSWTDQRIETLTKMWTEGKSASDIAKELGEVTRNAVIGKVHRLGLKGRVTKETKPVVEAPKKPAKPKVEKTEVVESEELLGAENHLFGEPIVPTLEMIAAIKDEIPLEAREQALKIESQSKRLNLMQLTERTCKWPVGDPATEDFWFCGHPSKAGKPYCDAHVELAFQAPMSRRDRRG